MKKFEHLSAFIECSSGVIPTVERVKSYLDVLSKMGYNRLYLGMADAYKIKEEPFFNYKRGGYTKEDLNEMDEYAKGCGIELIGQIHTLSHLHFLRKYPEYFHLFDTDNVLLVGEERVYVLIENMVKAISEGLSTRRIHIGFDEVFHIGTGEYLKKYGPADKMELMLKHLKRVLKILEKYGYTCELWGDMLVDSNGTKITAAQIRDALPDDCLVFDWDYEEKDESKIEARLDRMSQCSKNIAFAGAVWKYLGYGPCNRYSMERLIPQMKACYKKGISHYMITLWSDDVSRASVDATLPSLYIAAEYANGNFDGENELDKDKFERIVGVKFDDMMALDYVDDPFKTNSGFRSSSSFWMLFNDLLLGNFDLFSEPNASDAYAALAEEYAAKKNGNYGHLFEMSESVMRVLSKKATLVGDIRTAYANKDKAALALLIDKIADLKEALSDFVQVFSRYFRRDNRPFGLEVHHLYLGGQLVRCDYTIERIRAFIENDEIIEELEGGVLPINYDYPLSLDCSCMVDYKMLISYCLK